MLDKATWYAFVLLALLIAAVYFIGVATDAGALAAALQKLVFSVSGRDTNGQFANYPGGANQPKQ